MIYSPASSLADRSRVWVGRSHRNDDIDAIMDTLFGPSAGSSAVHVAAWEGRRGAPADGRHFCPVSDYQYGSTLKHPAICRERLAKQHA